MPLTIPLTDDNGLPILDENGVPIEVQRTQSEATRLLIVRMWPVLVKHHGVLTAYERDGTTPKQMVFVKGQRGVEVIGADVQTSLVADEWFCLVSDLITAALLFPKKGDRIKWYAPHGVLQTLEVLRTGTGRQWSYVDNEGTIAQIFTKQVA